MGKRNIAELRRQLTKDDLIEKLEKYGKCALVRCTGFGKTWLLSEMTERYKKVLYLYPAEVIKDTAVGVVKSRGGKKGDISSDDAVFGNIRFMTYMTLIRIEDFNEFEDYDLIVFDEAHRIGADKTKEAVRELFDVCPNAHFIGATATPVRGDAIDVVEEYFDRICVFQYTLHDAFQDGIIQRPIYCYCTYDIETDLKHAALTAGEDINNMKVWESISSKILEIGKLYNIPTIIRDVVATYRKKASYQKYIVFFASKRQMEEKGDTVIGWYKEAFPDHDIRTLTISSSSAEETANVKKLSELKHKSNTIDLIFCINMLNMGYHVDDLTGVMMYRGTSSNIIFAQQLGRVLSTGASKQCVVFDIVDNLHRKAIFDINEKGERQPTGPVDGKGPNRGPDEDGELITPGEIPVDTGIDPTDDTDIIPPDTWVDYWWKNCNKLYKGDLIADGHMATRREIIAKMIGESLSQRIKRAQESWEKRYCKMHKVTYPLTDQKLLEHGLDRPPIKPYAKWQNVTVRQLTDAILSGHNLGDYNKGGAEAVVRAAAKKAAQGANDGDK